MTLLLGPPGSGKSTLLLAVAGRLDSNLKKSGKITYNGHEADEFCVQRTSAYVGQTDNRIAELTVTETLDFVARCQGASARICRFGSVRKGEEHSSKSGDRCIYEGSICWWEKAEHVNRLCDENARHRRTYALRCLLVVTCLEAYQVDREKELLQEKCYLWMKSLPGGTVFFTFSGHAS
ncbi:ABC transporter G family member 39-like [Humulus lupulus]|uniref:ABC transporter G family member 39-like n=1 Tax=Humulus lupulus TaxID=3486 RepID=UPI002B412186|nr:ABC transporter G family member 39-like [Humulus lupulus]XP_062076096.1 ABC transporter G family member 39-like [Humulus lupulus]